MTKRLNPVEAIRINARERDLSLSWYRSQIKRVTTSKTQLRTSIRNQSNLVTSIEIGKMYLFTYDPKFKDVLPVYDIYPLVFPFNRAKGGFLGINLHYLPYGFRFYIIQMLEPYAQGKLSVNKEIERVKISWAILNKIAGVGGLDSAVKHYLTSHVKSSFMEIQYPDWKTASALPLESFKKNT